MPPGKPLPPGTAGRSDRAHFHVPSTRNETIMIKKIPIEALQVGMYIHDLNCSWADHDFLLNRFRIRGEGQIAKIQKLGIRYLYIDTQKGDDYLDAPTEMEVKADLENKLLATVQASGAVPRPAAHPEPVSIRVEMARAQKVQKEALRVVHDVMMDVRMGRQVESEKVAAVVGEITQSIFRNPDALLSLCRIKKKDTYTFEHCVSVCALLTSFACSLGMDQKSIQDAGIGGLIHDLGKMMVPDEILNKPGRLTEPEFEIVKGHVNFGRDCLSGAEHISPLAMEVTSEHHERYDGTGYPKNLCGNEISMLGRMAAIVDVYDAITSDRVYHKGIAPHEAIRKLYEWSTQHFEPSLVENFIRVVGIYPTGSVVTLKSGRVGVVITHRQDDLLHPVLRIIYDYRREARVPPFSLDLAGRAAREQEESIVGLNEEIVQQLEIHPMDYL